MAFHWLSFSHSISSTRSHNNFFMQIFHANLKSLARLRPSAVYIIFHAKFSIEFFYRFSVELSVQTFAQTFGRTFGRNFSIELFYRFSVELSVQTFGPKFGHNFHGIWSASDREGRATRGPEEAATEADT